MLQQGLFNVIFMGTGVSTAIPNLGHILNSENVCKVCEDATNIWNSKNKRNNVSIAVTFLDNGGNKKCLLVDVGKTMRDGCLKFLPKHGISEVNGIILTHGHADAIFGLDDARDLQKCESVEVADTTSATGFSRGFRVLSGILPIYLNNETMDTVKQVFGYLTNEHQFLDKENKILQRRVAYLDFRVIDSNEAIQIYDLPIRCFPVYHGGTYVSLGFSFGKEGEFVYISDVKIVPEESMTYLKSIPKIKILVIDALDRNGIYSHMGLDEALAVVAELQPETVYLTGISCGMGLHCDVEALLAERCPNTHVAYDGMYLEGLAMF